MVLNMRTGGEKMPESRDKAACEASKTSTAATMTKTAYAEHRGVSRRAVHKAIASGRIARAELPNGKLDVALADQLWRENSDPFRGGRRDKVRMSEAEALERFADCTAKGEVPPIAVSRIVLLYYRAQSLKLEYEIKTGALVDQDEVATNWFRLGRTARDALLAVPDRLAAELAGESDPARIHRRLVGEFTTALGPIMELTDGLPVRR